MSEKTLRGYFGVDVLKHALAICVIVQHMRFSIYSFPTLAFLARIDHVLQGAVLTFFLLSGYFFHVRGNSGPFHRIVIAYLIDCCINNAMIQRKENGNSDWAMQPRSFAGELRIASMEPRISPISSSTSLGQLFASSRLAKDQTPSSGLSCGAYEGKCSMRRRRWRSRSCSTGSPLCVDELSSKTMIGPRRWRSNSRKNTQTSSCPMLS
jgi:hypothetical protein